MQIIKLLSVNTLVRVNSVNRECIKRTDLYSLTITVYFMNADIIKGLERIQTVCFNGLQFAVFARL